MYSPPLHITLCNDFTSWKTAPIIRVANGMFEKTAIGGCALEEVFRSEVAYFRRIGRKQGAKRKASKCERTAVEEQSPFFRNVAFLITFLRQWEKGSKAKVQGCTTEERNEVIFISNQPLSQIDYKLNCTFTIYPNPSIDGDFIFDYDNLKDGNTRIEIFDITGKRIYHRKSNQSNYNFYIEKPGIYIFKLIENEEIVHIQKIVRI